MTTAKFTAAGYTEREEDYVQLLYANKTGRGVDLGTGSLFAAAFIDPQRDTERLIVARALPIKLPPLPEAPKSSVTFEIDVADPILRDYLSLTRHIKAEQKVALLFDNRATGGAMQVRVGFPWLEASLRTGYVPHSETTVSVKTTSPLSGADVPVRTELQFDAALGANLLNVELRKRFVEANATPLVDITGKPALLPVPDAVEIVMMGTVVSRVSFANEEQRKAFPTERSRILLAAFGATKIVCLLASLRIMRAVAVVASLPFPPEMRIKISELAPDAAKKVLADAGLPASLFELVFQQETLATERALGRDFLAEIMSNRVLLTNAVTPLRRIRDHKAVERETDRDAEFALADWRSIIKERLGANDMASQTEVNDAIARSEFDAVKQALEVAVKHYPVAADGKPPLKEDEALFSALRSAFEKKLVAAVRDTVAGRINKALGECQDESAAVQQVINQYSANTATFANQIGVVYLLAAAKPSSSEFVSIGSSVLTAELGAQLRRVRECIDEKDPTIEPVLDAIAAALNDVGLYRTSLTGEYDSKSLHATMLKALPDDAKRLAEGMLAISGIARSLSALLRRRIFIAANAERTYLGLVSAAKSTELQATDAEVMRAVKQLSDIVVGKDASTEVPAVAVMASEIRVVVVRLDAIVSKIENAAFDSVVNLKERVHLTAEDSRERYDAMLTTLRSARVYANALRQLYETGKAPDISQESDLTPEDAISLSELEKASQNAVVNALAEQLGETFAKARELAPLAIQQSFADVDSVLGTLRSSLSVQRFVDRMITSISTLRTRVYQVVHANAVSARFEQPQIFAKLADAMRYMKCAAYLTQIQVSLEHERHDTDAQMAKSIDAPMFANERILAEAMARALVGVIVTVDPKSVGMDVDVYNKDLIGYKAVLQQIADSRGANSFVPIPTDKVLEEYFESKNLDTEKVAIANIAIYSNAQTEYFRILGRPIPQSSLLLVADFQLTDGERDAIKVGITDAVRGLANQIRPDAEPNTPLALANEWSRQIVETATIVDNAVVSDQQLVAMLSRIADLCYKFYETVFALRPIRRDVDLAAQFDAVKKIESAAVALLADYAHINKQKAPPELRDRNNWLPDQIDDELRRRAEAHLPTMSASAAAFLPVAVFVEAARLKTNIDSLVDEMAKEESMKKLRALYDRLNSAIEGSTDPVQLARMARIDALLQEGAALLGVDKLLRAQLATYEKLAPERAAERQVVVVQLERLRSEIYTHQLRVEQMSVQERLAGWLSVKLWIEIVTDDSLVVARIIDSLPKQERLNLDAAVAQSRVAFLEEMRNTATVIGRDLNAQLKDIEKAARDALEAEKTGKTLVTKLESLAAVVTDVQTNVSLQNKRVDEVRDRISVVDTHISVARNAIDVAAKHATTADSSLKSVEQDLRRAEVAQLREDRAVKELEKRLAKLNDRVDQIRTESQRLTAKLQRPPRGGGSGGGGGGGPMLPPPPPPGFGGGGNDNDDDDDGGGGGGGGTTRFIDDSVMDLDRLEKALANAEKDLEKADQIATRAKKFQVQIARREKMVEEAIETGRDDVEKVEIYAKELADIQERARRIRNPLFLKELADQLATLLLFVKKETHDSNDNDDDRRTKRKADKSDVKEEEEEEETAPAPAVVVEPPEPPVTPEPFIAPTIVRKPSVKNERKQAVFDKEEEQESDSDEESTSETAIKKLAPTAALPPKLATTGDKRKPDETAQTPDAKNNRAEGVQFKPSTEPPASDSETKLPSQL